MTNDNDFFINDKDTFDENSVLDLSSHGYEDNLLKDLNEQQKEAVLTCEGPVLVLAGAGSGKTRVITRRIAYLILCKNIEAQKIFALTFTNKAANEMKERLRPLLGEFVVNRIWVGTFHSMFVRILRKNAELLSYSPNFSIVDTDDQIRIIKEVLKDFDNIRDELSDKKVLTFISSLKNKGLTWQDFENKLQFMDYKHDLAQKDLNEQRLKVYKAYQEKLQILGAMDFDDILLNMMILFERYPDIRDFYSRKFSHILVDEYQDTNNIQYQLINSLTKYHQNICVVGDDDQSIYSFRGANVEKILSFEKDYQNCKIIKLEDNYRSSQRILNLANIIISHNKVRKNKVLRPNKSLGEKVRLIEAQNNYAEVMSVVEQIKTMVDQGESYSNFAILYRINSVSRLFEQQLRYAGIPMILYGGLSFYGRKVVKDVLAYLRFIINPHDALAFTRIINYPPRGIGNVSQKKITDYATYNNIDLLSACEKLLSLTESGFSSAVRKSLKYFIYCVKRLKAFIIHNDKGLDAFRILVLTIIKRFYLDEAIKNDKAGDKNKKYEDIQNLLEILSDVDEFAKTPLSADLLELYTEEGLINEINLSNNIMIQKNEDHDATDIQLSDVGILSGMNNDFDLNQEDDFSLSIDEHDLKKTDSKASHEAIRAVRLYQDDPTSVDISQLPAGSLLSLNDLINAYLERSVLFSGTDLTKDNTESVKLMTIHSAKGLEFKNVFIVALEEGIFPSFLAKTPAEIEEERRLAYVAVTRAMDRLFLSFADTRTVNGKTEQTKISRFLNDAVTTDLEEEYYRDNRFPITIPNNLNSNYRYKREFSPLGFDIKKIRKDLKQENSLNSKKAISIAQLQTQTVFKHEKFGKGILISYEILGNNDAILKLLFEDYGEKNLLLSKSNLTLLE